jgi:hypothetical protein
MNDKLEKRCEKLNDQCADLRRDNDVLKCALKAFKDQLGDGSCIRIPLSFCGRHFDLFANATKFIPIEGVCKVTDHYIEIYQDSPLELR